MTRQTKTAKQRAEEQLAVANRKVIRLDREVDALRLELSRKRAEQTEAIELRDFLKQHPALQPAPTKASTTSISTTNQEGTNP